MIDIKIQRILDDETARQLGDHNFIASENFASEAVMHFCGSDFTNKYAEGYPGKRYYNGCENYDKLEEYGISLVRGLYGCRFANIQPHSGAGANLAIFKAFLKPGDTILGMDLSAGGHLSHGSPANISGSWFDNHFYGVDESGWLDYDHIQTKARALGPKLIICGASAYPRQIDFRKFREIADSVGALLLVDMAHYSGLIAGGSYQSPVEHADFITSTTHKTLRGARGGMILWNNEDFSKKINAAVFPGTQGGPLMNQVAGKAQAYWEASQPNFKKYAQDIILASRYMCEILIRSGIKITTGGTDSHIVLIHTGQKSGREVADILESRFRITVNKNSIPNDTKSFLETSGIRIGTAAMVTKLGFDKKYFRDIALKIARVISE